MIHAVPPFVEVALPVPLFRNFIYATDSAARNPLVPGTRVLVPFGKRTEVGICISTDVADPGRAGIRAIIDVPDAEPAVTPELLQLCRFMSEYYIAPLGSCLRSALPLALASAKVVEPSRRTRRMVRLRDDMPSLLHRDKAFARAPQQRAVFELLERSGGIASLQQLRSALEFSPSVLRGLVTRGLVSVDDEEENRDPFASRDPGPGMKHQPTSAQHDAVTAILAGAAGAVFLLHGVTGSGKTLVYIEVLRSMLAEGRTAIVLVPEISLTPQAVDRFRAAFGNQVAVLHSALSDGERYDAWLSLKRGERRIAVGARSAVFAPLENIGVIIVDEEHEATYKQNEAPRYHAREIAIMRARQAGATVVLGSATPSVESWHNAKSGKYSLITLADRVGGGALPHISAVDMRARGKSAGALGSTFAQVFSPELERALEQCLERSEQSILLLNRRGHSAFLQCRNCLDVITCPNCSISLTYHSVPERLICHYCGHSEEVRRTCARCKGETVRQRGVGTQQVERLVSDRFPEARIARMDIDTTGEKWAHTRILDRVASGEVDILLGTQMIAKGLDFPGITLVGVVDADVGINLPDFRASERCFQLVSQVAGRAGRGAKRGAVIVQTRSLEHHAVRCAMAHDFASFMKEELGGRVEPAFPPFIRLANIVFSGTSEQETAGLAKRGSEWVHRLIQTRRCDVIVVGPAPCPIERIKSRWRWHVLLKSTNPNDMTRVLRYFMERHSVPKRAQLRVTVDRDPVALL